MTPLELLLVCHFIGDWLLQTHDMAIRKTSEWKVRAVHCAIWTACFAWFVPWPWLIWLYVSHYVIDTYKPLYWFRKMRGDYKTWEEFRASFATPAGFMVNVTFDQVFHVLTLLPVIPYCGGPR